MTLTNKTFVWWEPVAETTGLSALIRLINTRRVKIDLAGTVDNTIFAGVPNLAWDYNAQAMLDAGHLDGEALVRVDDQTGSAHHAYPTSTHEPVLEANGCGNQAVFNFTGKKGAQTATNFVTPTSGCTVFAVVKRTGSHVENSIWWRFATIASPLALGTGLAVWEGHHFGASFDQDNKLEVTGSYIDVIDTEWVVTAVRYTNSTVGEFFVAGQRTDLYSQGAVFQGTSFNPGTEGDSPCAFTIGDDNYGIEGKSPRQMGFGAALTNAEMLTVAKELAALYNDPPTLRLDNGQSMTIKSLTELTTIAAAATTDTTILIPAGAIVLGVPVRVTTAIPTAVTFTVGDSGSAARYSTTTVPVAINSSDKGTKAGAYYNATATAVRITPSTTPGSNVGRVRVTVFYLDSVPPTS